MKLKQAEFETIQSKIYDYCGINLHEGKQALVRARVMKRIRKLGLRDFAHYIKYLEEDSSGEEFLALVDVLTTNKTSFFRESQHFDFIVQNVLPEINGRQVKWWSAGCSSGEEPVTCSIVLQEQNINPRTVKILGTDISRDVIRTAKRGVYPAKRFKKVSPQIIRKYFDKGDGSKYRVSEKVRRMITYGRLNLKKKWPLNGPFQVIMCRNVMIYFNRQTQQELVTRFRRILEPGGYLFLGHSESIASADRNFENVSPAVYRKK
ncbi:protein-glutamate O-methyltransferase CheR [Fodinibius sp. Rm-B-1B1-1]|uniref:CheR family methyltransferase n=1 Tax=Fodinibius alkaliphilus TaxID=3140241 RepID=UPI00315A5BA8